MSHSLRFLCVMSLALSAGSAARGGERFPGAEWPTATPESAGLDSAPLSAMAEYLGGRGCVVRHGKLVFQWGDAARPGDVASAAKPWYTTFLALAEAEGRIPSVDTPISDYVQGLQGVDQQITFAHMANQVSCYGVKEAPGTAYDYNDWQMALFVDTLFGKVFGVPMEQVDEKVFRPLLADRIGCQDSPSLLAFGMGDRPGRLSVSPRDFARFGWLYLNEGNWNGVQVLSRAAVRRAVRSPLPNSIPRTTGEAAPMLPGQRTMGSGAIPDNQTDHYGSYSWAWWLNGVDREGTRFWPEAPADTYAALGHANGQRGVAVIPSLDLVVAWNDTTLGNRPSKPHPLNEAFRLVMNAAEDGPLPGQIIEHPDNHAWLVRNQDTNGDGRLDSFYWCGPGDPEGFLFLGERRADGTRDGDQEAIIARLAESGANALYVQAIRSHGGDGEASHNPFVDSDPAKGLDEDILRQWDNWLTQAEEGGIVVLFFIYDDSASIWNTGDSVGPEEEAFLKTLVNRLDHHGNLVWCIAEEYQERLSPARMRAIARVIRAADEHNHVVAAHKLNGLSFEEFQDDPLIRHFAIQYNVPTADEIHAGMVQAWNDAAGRYSINLSECADYGFGAEARRKHWAAALGGAPTMPIEWKFEDPARPARPDLEACGHVVRFMEGTELVGMAPQPDLAAGGTAYVLAAPGKRYLAYAPDATKAPGLSGVPAGSYALTWLDPASGREVKDEYQTQGGACTLTPPEGFAGDVALRLVRLGEAQALGHRAAVMWGTEEWTVKNPSHEGNPFDLVATVRFEHPESGNTHATEMFYAGEDQWSFRFTGDRLGDWAFRTESADPELDGLTGSVTVSPNPNAHATGFLTHVGNKFALQHNDADDLRGYLFSVYMNNNLVHTNTEILTDPDVVDAVLDDTEKNGSEVAFAYLLHHVLKLGALRHDEHTSVNPDLETFAMLDSIIQRAHARGMRWHLWMWGDEARKWTPRGLPGGINGEVDRRLQRYIAARLGPLPGWTMGYGFDLIEWTSEEGRNGWVDYLHGKMGWDHLLCTRGFHLKGEENNMTSYSGFGGQDLTTTRGGPSDFAEVMRHIDADPLRPSFYEERHSYQREGFQLSMEGTRRLRWWQAMAGGLGGFFGFYKNSPYPYPNPEQLRTAKDFWEGRFRLDMARANGLTNGACLKTGDNTRYVFYIEGADAIDVDLSGMPAATPAVAVDTTQAYAPISLGLLEPTKQTIALPKVSDWAIAVEPGPERHASVLNGRLQHEGEAVIGWVAHNGWWRPGQRPNLTRRSVGDPEGDVRPNRTEDLDALSDNMLRFAYPAFEHNYGLWYDRRRDAHDTAAREDANVVPPFLEQPWARSGEGKAWDGATKYDLESFNSWYFARLKRFADLCDAKGTFLLHKYHMQHNLLETPAHYVDFPWRPVNCVQDTGMPDGLPAANVFYDISHPERRRLHRLYIRHCLDVLGGNRNVIHMPAEEFTGPLAFSAFFVDTVVEWERETGRRVNLCASGPKDVVDGILNDPARAPYIDTIDLRYFWTRKDGSLFAPKGGDQMPGRGLESGSKQTEETSPELLYAKVRQYRDRFPDKAIVDAYVADARATWAFFMAGGSLLVRGQIEYPGQVDPEKYIEPMGVDEFLGSYGILREGLGEAMLRMHPVDGAQWRLEGPDGESLTYLKAGEEMTAPKETGAERCSLYDVATGKEVPLQTGQDADRLLWLQPAGK